MLERYGSAIRQVLLLETLYPGIAELSEIWYFLPFGRPDGLRLESRYILFCYRMAQMDRDQLACTLASMNAIPWARAIEAEATYAWSVEQNLLADQLATLVTLPELNIPVPVTAVA